MRKISHPEEAAKRPSRRTHRERAAGLDQLVDPIWMLLRTKVPHGQSSTVPKNREYVAKHARLIGQMMEPELAGDEIETLRPKRQHRALGLNPCDLRPLALRLTQHTK